MRSLAVSLATCVALSWLWSGTILDLCRAFGRPKPPIVRAVFAELRPFYLPAVLFMVGDSALHGEMHGWNSLFAALSLAAFWAMKGVDDDDRWKRRRRKVAEKVARVGGRLAVVPAGSGAS